MQTLQQQVLSVLDEVLSLNGRSAGFDRDTPLPPDFLAEQERRRSVDLPHELYDVTAWSVGPMAGVDVALCNAAASLIAGMAAVVIGIVAVQGAPR